jgi:hypothetical protein
MRSTFAAVGSSQLGFLPLVAFFTACSASASDRFGC